MSGLDSWILELADAAHQLLAEYHDVFFGPHGVGRYSLHRAYDKGNESHPL